MPVRRSHQKSHHGCSTCKRRKIKCDESRPECKACLKKQLICGFLEDHALTGPYMHYLGDQPSSSNRQISVNSDPLPLLELELLHQWHTSTAPALSRDQEVSRVMKDIIPREGFAHPFLIYGLLSIAALHRIRLDGVKNALVFAEASIEYKQQALSLYTPLLNNITRSNCNALFAFSCLLSILCFASQTSDVTRTVKEVADVVEIFRLVRGVAVVVEKARQWIESSEVSVLLFSSHFDGHDLNSSRRQGSSDVEGQLRQLLSSCHETCKDSSSMLVYTSSIQYLIYSYSAYSTTSDNTVGLAWPVLVDPRFFDFLLEKEQLSLVILAHYGAIMALCNDTWWMDGWGQLVIRLTSDLLHPTWLCKIEWPLQVLHGKEC
jgi:hypothetical protein